MPDENLLGDENRGFNLIMANFQWELLLMALGGGRQHAGLLERTLEFVLERAGARPPDRGHQAIRHKIAEMAPSWPRPPRSPNDALRRFVEGENVAPAGDHGQAELAARLLRRDGRVFADPRRRRYMKEQEIERAARDARLGPIGGGTDEIMSEIRKTMGL